jgi:hypothetical protein
MARSIRLAIAIGLLAALVVGTGPVAADRGDPTKILDTRLVGVPNPPVTVVGVNGAGAAWTTDDSRAKLFSDGTLDLRIRGLVFTTGPNAGTNTVAQGRATVVCNGNANPATDRVDSDPIAFSIPDGDAHFDGLLTLPSPCFAPVVFFTSVGGAWFAVSG